jgi:succinyl-diaminopimelate desuccinylase
VPISDPVRLLKDLIRCPSVTPEAAGALDVLEAALQPLGFTVTRLTFDGGGSYPVDNVAWTHPPFAAEEADGRLYGRGAADMKSGIAAFIAAAEIAVADGSADSGTISLAITNDEEADAVNGTDKLLAWATGEGHRFDFAIVGEPSARQSVGDSIKIGRRGSLNGRITVTGVQGHVAYPEKARNPLPALASIVAALSGKLDDGNAQFPPSNLEFTSIDVGNAITNVIPARATARFNVRYNDHWDPESLTDRLNDWLVVHKLNNEAMTDCSVELEVVGRGARSFLSPPGDAVEALCATIERLTGKRPELSTGGGNSDARFIAPYCPVVECGLPGPTMHQIDERVAVADVRALSDLYAAFIGTYLGGNTT